MHRTIGITAPAGSTAWLPQDLEKMGHVVGLSVLEGALVMVLAYRRSLLAGPLIALILIPAAALVGAAAVAGRPGMAHQGLDRPLIDAALVVGLGTLVVLVEQATVHRRQPLV